jgi:hypothetical protein
MDLLGVVLHCIALHCIALHCIALHCIALQYVGPCLCSSLDVGNISRQCLEVQAMQLLRIAIASVQIHHYTSAVVMITHIDPCLVGPVDHGSARLGSVGVHNGVFAVILSERRRS